MKIGVDYSLTSPALCIELKDKYKFISFFDGNMGKWKNSTSKKYYYHQQLDGIIDQYQFNRYVDKTNYRTEQNTKMKCAKDLSDYVFDTIMREIWKSDEKLISPTNPITIAIEGFSYGSLSSSYIDLVMYQSFLRSKLLSEFPFMNLHIISPTEAKKTLSGKGNSNKEEMIRSFIDNSLNDPKLVDNKLWKYLQDKELDYKNIKPIDDCVDAYAILKSI